ncbi:MAG TPA: type II toxin-antitoxin system VapC family toxin [Candidatus Binataceae bacterium]|nr:type II toxin-antitoxin system VapC family toxin [Candidatus Binataceae bacterium]
MGFLIDTCVWIDVERGVLAPADVASLTGDEPVFLSPVTIAELKFGAEAAADPQVRTQRLAALARIRRKPSLSIDTDTGEIFGRLAAQLKSASRKPRSRVQDLWIASQAIQHSFHLLTRNEIDFEDIPGLEMVSYRLSR